MAAKAEIRKQPTVTTVGRPSLFTDTLAERVINELIAGKSLRQICKEDWAPSTYTVLKWLDEKPEFSAQYMRARELQAEAVFDEVIEIADETQVQSVVGPDGEVEVKLDATAVARNRLRVDARKWALARMSPRRYGDKITQENVGADGGPIQHSLVVEFVKPKPR